MIWRVLFVLPLFVARVACWVLLPSRAEAWVWDRWWACLVGFHYRRDAAGLYREQCRRCGDETWR